MQYLRCTKKLIICFAAAVFFAQFAYAKTSLPDILKLEQSKSTDFIDGARLPDFVKLAKEVSPAVVNVSTLVKPKVNNNPFMQYGPNNQQIPLPELFKHFFGGPQPSQPPQNQKPVPRSLGSGFILSKDGYIITNYHVVKDADEILVRLKNRSEYKAKLVGSDPKTDIALLKIDAHSLPTVKLGDSDKSEPGQWVFAIGSPFGFNYSVTKGIVSALNRSLPISNETYVPFIQTDVPINPGNSGGPLVDMQGRVIGINSIILTQSGGFMGVSFAIPINEAAYVVKQLQEHGKVVRGWIGVLSQYIDQKLSKSFGLPHPEGALISQVIPKSPADKAGFKSGDIILELNNKRIEFFSELPAIVANIPVKSKVNAVLWRDGKRITVPITIEKKPKDGDLTTGLTNSNNLGIQVETLNTQWRHNLDLDSSVSGVVVTSVAPNSIGSELQLKPHDVITQMGNDKLKNTEEFNKAAKALLEQKGDVNVAVRIIRHGQPMYRAFSLSNGKEEK